MSDEQRAQALIDRYWEELLELEPLFATQIGDERYDDRLSDPSDEGVARREVHEREALRELESIDRSSLDRITRTSLDVLEAGARRGLAETQERFDRLAAVSHFWGPGELLVDLGTLQRADTPERLDRYVERLRAIPAFLRASASVAMDGARAGVVRPKIVAERALAQIERLLEIPLADSPGLLPIQDGDRDHVAGVLRDVVMPGYERYLESLREYAARATDEVGLSALPGGDRMYASQILGWTTLELGADEVHRLGTEALAATQQERTEAAASLGFPDAASAIASRTAGGQNTAKSKDDLVRLAEEQVARSWEAAPAYFGRLPRESCEVRAVEEFREADMAFAFYQPPSGDGSRRGIYYVNGFDLPNRPLHHLAATTFHEATPGHHFQVTLEQEHDEWPALRRFGGILAGSAFIEGWGLYSERLADEMGLYLDEWERLGMLDAQAHRAARLVVDTGMHALGWRRERSIEVLEEAGVPNVDAVIETDRYIALPGQALSYKIGQIEIERARDQAQRRAGEGFSLQDFHDGILALGSVPLPALRRELGG